MGLFSSAYSAAGSALTALTTSFTLDILQADKKAAKEGDSADHLTAVRKKVHVGMAVLMAVVIFAAGTLLGALAVNVPMLLAARLVMSLGTGISLSLITSIILEKRRLNSAARCSASSVWSPALHRPSARYSAAC